MRRQMGFSTNDEASSPAGEAAEVLPTPPPPEGTFAPDTPPPAPREKQLYQKPGLQWSVAAPPPVLVGRDMELPELLANYQDGVLILSEGGGGLGATALARQLAYQIREQFPDGCLEIDLRGSVPLLVEPLDAEEAMRRLLRPFHLDQPLPEDFRELGKLYRKTFRERRVLLLLDDAASASQLRYLLPRGDSLAIVTTCQVELRTSFPRLYALLLRGLSEEDALALLVQVVPDAERISWRVLRQLISRLDGVPLALRIIAPLLLASESLSPRRLLRRLNAAHKRVVALHGPISANTAVEIALEVVYEALPEGEQRAFEALAVFPAPFTKGAAAAVWQWDGEETERFLFSLVRRNLVNYRPVTDTYDLHLLVRLYAQELLLGQPGRPQELVTRYANYMLQEAIRLSSQEQSRTSAAYGTQLSLLWEHLQFSWQRALGEDPGWPAPENIARWVCDLPIRIMPVLNIVLSRAQLRAWLERALEMAEQLEDRRAEGLHLGALGRIHRALGDAEQALVCHEKQLQIAHERRDRYAEADALMYLGLACGSLGDLQRAQMSWRQAVRLFELVGDQRQARVQRWLTTLEERLAGQHR